MELSKATGVLMGALLMLSHTAEAKLAPQPYVTDSGLALVPILGFAYQYDDNVTLAETQRRASHIVALDAALNLLAERDLATYQLSYKINAAQYLQSSMDDFVDHHLAAEASLDLALRHRVSLDYQFDHQHEQRGRGLSQGIGSELTELLYFQANKLKGKYSYGAERAVGRLDVQLGWEDKHYQNLPALSQTRNWRELSYAATLFYRVSSASELLFETKQLLRRYRQSAAGQPSRDNDDRFIYVGAEWEMSGKSSGSARIGYEDKRYRSALREKFSGLSWLLSFNYLPLEYSLFNVLTSRAAKDPDQLGNYINESLYQASWQHYWLERSSTELLYSKREHAYHGVERHENILLAKFSISHELRRWLKLSGGYQREQKSSTAAGLSYQQNMLFVHLTGTI